MRVVGSFQLNPAGLFELLESPTGPVGRWTLGVASRVLTRAVALTSGTMVNVVTGELRDSLSVELEIGQGGWPLSANVTAASDHAMAVHSGSPARTITPKRGKALKFPRSGIMVYAHSVDHPGSAPKPFLSRALAEVMASV